MASTENKESAGQADISVHKKRFTAFPDTGWAADGTDAGKQPGAAGALMSRTAAIGGVAMGAAALLCFVLATGFSGDETPVSDETSRQVFSLREQIRLAEAKAAALPDAKDAERALVMAQTSAGQVAALQNDYRNLAPRVAAADGRLGSDAMMTTRRNLIPYFAPSVGRDSLAPWYLLASDKDVPEGIGIPMSFDSGFHWSAQMPFTVNDDGTVPVTWLAVETQPAAEQTPVVLAWARADYDTTRKTFMNLETGITATGEELRLEVKTS
ncbi:hypothetical protein [Streptomyces sp. MMS24-I29]|uniref:hypothetical protein n=1 Tax=Streptomyces sp. MMS24-I29 TaxID=3351480 RepID=UPI003C7E971D